MSTGHLLFGLYPGLDLFLGVDFPLGKMEPSYFVPVNKFGLQLNLGMNITFGKLRKASKLAEKANIDKESNQI